MQASHLVPHRGFRVRSGRYFVQKKPLDELGDGIDEGDMDFAAKRARQPVCTHHTYVPAAEDDHLANCFFFMPL